MYQLCRRLQSKSNLITTSALEAFGKGGGGLLKVVTKLSFGKDLKTSTWQKDRRYRFWRAQGLVFIATNIFNWDHLTALPMAYRQEVEKYLDSRKMVSPKAMTSNDTVCSPLSAVARSGRPVVGLFGLGRAGGIDR